MMASNMHCFRSPGTACIINSMSNLPGPLQQEFIKGNHVMHHQHSIWNGLWSDLYIESMFMQYGHSPGGIVDITLKPSMLKR